jgi:glycine/D-amino acid oxidase-like deaminating enzyme
VVRSLEEAARRRIPRYARLAARDRAAALAQLTGFDANALAAAIYHPGLRRLNQLRSTIALLETARRRALTKHNQRSSNGTH